MVLSALRKVQRKTLDADEADELERSFEGLGAALLDLAPSARLKFRSAAGSGPTDPGQTIEKGRPRAAREMMEQPERGQPAAGVDALHRTPVTLGVVLALQAVAMFAVLGAASIIWGRVGTVEASVNARVNMLATEVSGLRNEVSDLKAKVAVLETRLEVLIKAQDRQTDAINALTAQLAHSSGTKP